MDAQKALQQDTLSRKKFLTLAAIGAAGIAGFGALARRKIKTDDSSLPFGIPQDSIFKPRADALERMRKGLNK